MESSSAERLVCVKLPRLGLKSDPTSEFTRISPSPFTAATYTCQTVSVNDRWVRGSNLMRVLDEGYRGTVASGHFPPVVISVEVDPRKVDVNVHPTKQLVRFSDERGVRRTNVDAIALAIQYSQAPSPSTRQSFPSGGARSARNVAHNDQRFALGGQREKSSRLWDRQDYQQPAVARPIQREMDRAHEIEGYRRRLRDASKPLTIPDAASSLVVPGSQQHPSSPTAIPQSTPEQEGDVDLPERGSLPSLQDLRVMGQFSLGNNQQFTYGCAQLSIRHSNPSPAKRQNRL